MRIQYVHFKKWYFSWRAFINVIFEKIVPWANYPFIPIFTTDRAIWYLKALAIWKKYLEKFAAAKFESSFFFLLFSREDLLIWRRLMNLVGKDGKEGQRSLITKILMIVRRVFESWDCIWCTFWISIIVSLISRDEGCIDDKLVGCLVRYFFSERALITWNG